MDQLTEAEIPLLQAEPGHALALGDGATLEVIAVGDQGAVLLLTHGNFRFLISTGADPDLVSDPLLWDDFAPPTGLLLPDGGNASVNTPEWLSQLQPQMAIISVDAGNLKGLPSQEVLQSLSGITILRTDLHGWIHLETDGRGCGWRWREELRIRKDHRINPSQQMCGQAAPPLLSQRFIEDVNLVA